jgi:CRP-like cAMP-binding protein
VTESVESGIGVDGGQARLSLATAAARNLATTTKSVPQMQEISPRWLLRVLPWVQVSGGTYRVNRRLNYRFGDGRITFSNIGTEIHIIPPELRELSVLRECEDEAVLDALASRFVQQEFAPGEMITELGHPIDQLFLIAHGKVSKVGRGKYGDQTVIGVLADGDYIGDQALAPSQANWGFTVRAVTRCTVMALPRQAFQELLNQSETLRTRVEEFHSSPKRAQNKHGEAAIDLASGHAGEADLPGTFVDYELAPREYELSVAQAILRVHTRVVDLYNEPMDQFEQQLRLTIEALRERQEHELINNHEFGLLHNADLRQRIHTRTGPPTPDDLDELLSRRRKPQFFLAHPRTIAAFGRECNRRGLYPQTTDIKGRVVPAWRGVPILPCDKIPISEEGVTSILVLRIGEKDQGVIGLHQTGIPDEYQPSLNVRFMGINDMAIISYLVSAYYSVAVLVPDALGVLDNVELGR